MLSCAIIVWLGSPTFNVISVSNQIKRSRVKWFKLGLEAQHRCYFTSFGLKSTLDQVIEGIRKRKKANEVILLNYEGHLLRL